MSFLKSLNLLTCALSIGFGAQASALADDIKDISLSGYMAGDLRLFSQKALYTNQRNQRLNPSILLNPEFAYEWNEGDDRLKFIPFARLDAQDKERTHADIRELKYLHIDDGWDVRIGLDKVFWGVTESRHLVDIINQADGVEDVDGEDKLGQPMVNLGLQEDWGDINLFVMPYFRERTFPGVDGRLRSAMVVDTDQAFYESRLGRYHPDLAVRYATVMGDVDIGFSQFHGTSREPRLVVGTDKTGASVLVPHYDIINQTGIDVQATVEEWLWKAEGIYRTGQGKGFGAVSAGLEYTFFGSIGTSGDLGLLTEYHYDARTEEAPSTLYNDDLFLGARVTLNDADDTDFLVGVLIDRLTQAQSYSVETSTRINAQLSLEAELRVNNNLQIKDPQYGARKDNHLQIRLTYYF